MKKNFRRGALLVEFAIILPLFLLIMLLILYGGIYLHDIHTLNEMSRSAVRYAVVIEPDDGSSTVSDATRETKVKTMLNAQLTKTPLVLFALDRITLTRPSSIDESDTSGDAAKKVTITLHATRKSDALIPVMVEDLIPNDISSSLAMRLEVE